MFAITTVIGNEGCLRDSGKYLTAYVEELLVEGAQCTATYSGPTSRNLYFTSVDQIDGLEAVIRSDGYNYFAEKRFHVFSENTAMATVW